ncbi:hypothetical protein BC829DRAFT_440518 [Chytridium lagenaria]|nr:hypothetical protein BC829DRAFT_440518 [Chytridium lagenaria]
MFRNSVMPASMMLNVEVENELCMRARTPARTRRTASSSPSSCKGSSRRVMLQSDSAASMLPLPAQQCDGDQVKSSLTGPASMGLDSQMFKANTPSIPPSPHSCSERLSNMSRSSTPHCRPSIDPTLFPIVTLDVPHQYMPSVALMGSEHSDARWITRTDDIPLHSNSQIPLSPTITHGLLSKGKCRSSHRHTMPRTRHSARCCEQSTAASAPPFRASFQEQAINIVENDHTVSKACKVQSQSPQSVLTGLLQGFKTRKRHPVVDGHKSPFDEMLETDTTIHLSLTPAIAVVPILSS